MNKEVDGNNNSMILLIFHVTNRIDQTKKFYNAYANLVKLHRAKSSGIDEWMGRWVENWLTG